MRMHKSVLISAIRVSKEDSKYNKNKRILPQFLNTDFADYANILTTHLRLSD